MDPAKATRTFWVLSQPVRNNKTARPAADDHIVVNRPELRGILDQNRARSERRGGRTDSPADQSQPREKHSKLNWYCAWCCIEVWFALQSLEPRSSLSCEPRVVTQS
jgi:hypothetical protein